MEKPVVVSAKGLEGIEATHTKELLVADRSADYVNLLDEILSGRFDDMGSAARAHVKTSYNWEKSLPEVVRLLSHSRQPDMNSEAVRHD